MPNTPEHKARMHAVSRDRLRAGQAVWDHVLKLADVFHDEALTFEQKRNAIVIRLRASTWFKNYDDSGELPLLVEELAGAETVTAFDNTWDEIYDIADADRVWIETH